MIRVPTRILWPQPRRRRGLPVLARNRRTCYPLVMRLQQNQVWRQGDQYIRIVRLERMAVEYKKTTAILANGNFPIHPAPLAALREAERIVCCDGATVKLVATGLEPAAIVGDLDSLPENLRARFGAILHPEIGQNDNDLAKAFRFCIRQGWRNLVILGATGLREDHTLGNLAWLADFARDAEVSLLTDTGSFTAVYAPTTFPSHPGQQVSIFTFDPQTVLHAQGLRYPVDGLRLTRWWQATLNEALGESFDLSFEGGPVLVFQTYGEDCGL